MQERLAQGELGSPVWLRASLALSADHGQLEGVAAAGVQMAATLLRSGWRRVYAQGGATDGQITALVDFAQGQSALVTAEVTLDEPRVSLLILGNHGSMQFTDFPLRPPIGAGPAGLRSALRDSLSKGEAVDAR